MNSIRAFIAIELSAEVRKQLDVIISQLKTRTSPAVRWTSSHNIHLTLKFLGESAPNNLDLLKKSLPSVIAQFDGLEFQVGTLGAFPNLRRPRVIWVGVQAPATLQDLQKKVEIEAERLGYPREDRPFSPHLTLGRVNQSASPQDLAAITTALSQMRVGTIGKVAVQKVILFRSDLYSSGPIYTPLASFLLS